MKMKFILPMMMLAAMPLAADAQNKSGLVLSNLDKTAKPADDFYQFATGGWQKNNPLPAATAVMVVSISWLRTTTSVSTLSLMSSRRRPTRLEPYEQKLSDFYKLRSISTAATRRALLL